MSIHSDDFDDPVSLKPKRKESAPAKTEPSKESESDRIVAEIRKLSESLVALAKRPAPAAPDITVSPPAITVEAPNVTVKMEAPTPVKSWLCKHVYNRDGDLSETRITAE